MATNAADAVPGTLAQGMKDDWFTELSSMWPGQGMSFKVNEVVHTARSDFQVRRVFFLGKTQHVKDRMQTSGRIRRDFEYS